MDTFEDFDEPDMDKEDDELWNEDEESEWEKEEESEWQDEEGSYTFDNAFNPEPAWTAPPATPAIASESKSFDDDYYKWNDDESSFSTGVVVFLAVAVVAVVYYIRGRSSAPAQNSIRAGYRPVPVPHGGQVGPKSHTK